jgi:hypothetical protein
MSSRRRDFALGLISRANAVMPALLPLRLAAVNLGKQWNILEHPFPLFHHPQNAANAFTC